MSAQATGRYRCEVWSMILNSIVEQDMHIRE